MSLALMFVPLTTVSMARIPVEQMGNATSIFNLLRNVGGSVGIAGVTTLLQRTGQSHMNTLGSHVTNFSSSSRAMMAGLQHSFEARGMPAASAAKQAYAAMYGMVLRQATMLSFVQVFRILGVIFLLLLPLLLIMKRTPKTTQRPTGVH
jgi:DHA2 family multidrug resistance protein